MQIIYHGEKKMNNNVEKKILLGKNADKPFVSISNLGVDFDKSNTQKIDINKSGIDKLSTLIQPAISAGIAGKIGSSNLMEVVVNGGLANASDGNGVRGYVVDSAGKIQEHARLFETENLQNIVNAAGLFQIVSFVVAQKHLADISIKLDEIKKEVENISASQKNERQGKIEAAMRYLLPIIKASYENEDIMRFGIPLETHLSEINAIEIHIDLEMNDLYKEINQLEKPTIFFGKYNANVSELSKKVDSLLNLWRSCIIIQYGILYILEKIYNEDRVQKERKSNLDNSVYTAISKNGCVYNLYKAKFIK